MQPVIIPAVRGQHTATLIFLHGLGDSGHGWSTLLGIVKKALPHFKLIFPHAPSRPVSLNGGMSMPAWYDIYSLEEECKEEDVESMKESVRTVANLIKEEKACGVKSVFVGGFSQGGAIALATGLSSECSGIISLSGYLPRYIDLKSVNHSGPIFMGHGTDDPIVKYKWGQDSCKALETAKYFIM